MAMVGVFFCPGPPLPDRLPDLEKIINVGGMVKTPLGTPGESTTIEIRVRYAECDAMGYLHHARYWEYFEQARTERLRLNGFRYRDLESEGCFFVVYKAAIKYMMPIHYDDLVRVKVSVARITRTRVDHTYAIEHEGHQTCEASTTLACVGRDGKPQLMPPRLWGEGEPDASER